MNVYVNNITGLADAITSMYMSKRSWTKEKEEVIRAAVFNYTTAHGSLLGEFGDELQVSEYRQLVDWIDKLAKWGWQHTTMLRFIDISCTVEGLHRAGQDDWDAHAKRFNNRIIRSSTRLATFGNEMSDWYEGKIIPTDVALATLGIAKPESIKVNGTKYVNTINGYIAEEYKDNKDVKRGLYMLSIPSNFIFKIDLCEFGHVYKERNQNSSANPEVKQCCEEIASQIERMIPQFNRELFLKIKN